jgi:long-subunit fatty acid transport protein
MVILYDEIFMNFGKKVTNNDFDQNRLGLMLGYKITPKLSLEMGYLNQYLKLRSRTATFQNRYENNHTLMTTVVTSF